MKEVVFAVLAIAVAALVIVKAFLDLADFEGNRDFICKKLFSRKKQCENLLIETELRRIVRG